MNRWRGRLEALGAVLALGLSAVAQFLLEKERPAPTTRWPALLFLIAAVAAVAATYRRSTELAQQPRLALNPPNRRWWLACLPGVTLIAATIALHGRVAEPIASFTWLTGIVLLLAVGAAHAIRQPTAVLPAPLAAWSRRRMALAVVILIGVALVMRTAFDIESLPAFVYADEIELGLDAKDFLQRAPFGWFRVFWVGMPVSQLWPLQAAGQLFGWNLWGLRMASVVMGTICVVATFGFGRLLIGNFPAFVGALLVAVAHTHLQWSRNVQVFIEPPMAAAIILWAWTRAWTGGSLLSWVLAAVTLGIGSTMYWSSHMFPLLILVTAAGWTLAIRGHSNSKSALQSTLAVEVIAILMIAPVAITMFNQWRITIGRPASLFILSHENRERLGDGLYSELWRHAKQTVSMFNTGADAYPNYAARRSLVDAVSAALVPVAAAMLLARISSPFAWMCTVWWVGFMVIGVLLTNHPPSYHRVPGAILFSSLAVAWALFELMSTICKGMRLPRLVTIAACLLFAAAATAANAHFYFYEYPRSRPLWRELGLVKLMCPYAKTHTVVNATFLQGEEFVPEVDSLLRLMCSELTPAPFSNRIDDLWAVDRFTHAEKVALFVASATVQAHPGEPHGYRVTRHFVDHRIKFPEAVPIEVYELERIDSDALPATRSDASDERHQAPL